MSGDRVATPERLLAEGKTKIVYADPSDPALALIVHKDDITAGDGARRHLIPGKGNLSGRTTSNVFRLLRGAGIETHFVEAPADDQMIVRRCAMIPLEVVMRRIATGSYVKRNDVAEGTRFDPPLVEFFFKDDARHDPLVSPEWVTAQGIATADEIATITGIGCEVFSLLEAAWAEQDVQLVDLKIEFGRDADGSLMVADVIDNDSWRIWPGGRKEAMLDKQVYRNTVDVTDEALAGVQRRYQQVAEMTDAFPAAPARTGKPREACGVFGVWAPGSDVARTTLLALMALQHRGQESAGVAVLEHGNVRVSRGMGRVDQIFRPEEVDALTGIAAIGHTRYSTMGGSRLENAQPVLVSANGQTLALAHNGNVVNPLELLRLVRERGVEPATGSDSELLALLILHGQGTWEERIRRMMELASGAYSLTILTPDALFAVRDPHGLRPLCLGWRNDHWMTASESCALDTVGAELVRDVQPGEILRLDDAGLRSELMPNPPAPALCVFEQVYFARPDSVLDGQTAFESRVEMGRELAREHPVEADLVIGVPDSGVPAAMGYAQEMGIPLSEGLVKNRYIGRTFIQPDQDSRQAGIRLKFNPLRGAVKNKRVVIVDDSIVRGNTMPSIVELLRRGGATAVHLRISAPPIAHPCHFGIDMGRKETLIAHGRDTEAIRRHIGADTLGYLSLDGLARAVGKRNHCFGCMTGTYPVSIDAAQDKNVLEAAAPAVALHRAKSGPSRSVLVVGSGAREHALVWALSRSPSVGDLWAAPGNPGSAELATLVDVPVSDINGLATWAEAHDIGLVVVGPEAPLAQGLADRFHERNIPVFGATRSAAELEWSKSFAKAFMRRHGIPTAAYGVFSDPVTAADYARRATYPLVVKADGLAAGKGVVICSSRDEAEAAIRSMLIERAFGDAGGKVVIEEFLDGEELSVIALVDGERIAMLPLARDYKRLYTGGEGPNTGGMGSFAPVTLPDPTLMSEVQEMILQPVVDGLRAEGRPYRGALYAGLMLTKHGPRVLEFNCRFGDPETQVILPLLEGDLVELLRDCASGQLDPDSVTSRPGAAVCVVLAAAGYPEHPRKGDVIQGIAEAVERGALVFHAGTARRDGELITSGGRVLSVVGLGDDVRAATEQAYCAADAIRFDGMQVRRDIGAAFAATLA
ncbi:MAG: phosphoribosylamine--glycine ligase [Thermomicrobiales bacterium]